MSCSKQKTLEDGKVLTSQIISCDETNCTYDGGTFVNIKSIDNSSTKTILDAICSLSESDLQKLADTIADLLRVDTANAPSTTETDYLPDQIAGDRTMLLGGPEHWVDIGGKSVPAYDN